MQQCIKYNTRGTRNVPVYLLEVRKTIFLRMDHDSFQSLRWKTHDLAFPIKLICLSCVFLENKKSTHLTFKCFIPDFIIRT